jgi:hypothetical protein
MLKARRATIQIPVKARASAAATCSTTYATTSAGTSVGSARNVPKPHRAQLQREPHPVVITTTLGDKTPVEVVKEEEPLQLRPRRSAYEMAIRRLSPAARLDDHEL